MAKRNAKQLAGEVNSGKKDVTFLPFDFDASLLTEENQAKYADFLKEHGQEPQERAPESDAPKTKTRTKRG